MTGPLADFAPHTASVPPDRAAKSRFVRTLFDSIAGRYDLINHVLSLGIDIYWRRVAATALAGEPAAPGARPEAVLDLCSGTGDLAFAIARAVARGRAPPAIVALDFSMPMLSILQLKQARRGRRVALPVCGDGLDLPFGGGTFDAAACAFGVRNLADHARGLHELTRVLRPGGRLAILDFGRPRGLLGTLYDVYFRYILPRIGRWLSGVEGPYGYLPASVAAFPPAREFARQVEAAGFEDVAVRPLTLGIALLTTARRRPDGAVTGSQP